MASFFFPSGNFTSLSARRKPRNRILFKTGSSESGLYCRRRTNSHRYGKSLCGGVDRLIGASYLRVSRASGVSEDLCGTCCVLLVFDVTYVLLGSSKTPQSKITGTTITNSRGISILLLSGAVLEFCIRIWHPIDRVSPLLNIRFGYLSQYALYYILGHLVSSPLDPVQLASPNAWLAIVGSLILTLSCGSKARTQTTSRPAAGAHLLSLMKGGCVYAGAST